MHSIFFRSVFSARSKEEILSEHDKPILSASVANQNGVFVLSCPFKFQSLTRQELVSLTRDQALLLFFFPLFYRRGAGGRQKVWKMSHERHDSKTGEGTTSGQYYAFLQDKITVKNNTSKALLSIRRGLFYNGFHFRTNIYTEKSSYNLHEVLYMCCVLASSLVTETTNSLIKFIDRAGVSAAELMIETATGLSQKRNAELSELRERQKGVEC